MPALTSKRTTRKSSSSRSTASVTAGDRTWVTTQSAHVAVARMQHVSQEMISDVVSLAMMLLAFSICVVGVSTHRHHRKGVLHGPERS
jgi:hypothetical protein